MSDWHPRMWGCGYCGTMAYALAQKFGWKLGIIYGVDREDNEFFEDYPHAVAIVDRKENLLADSVGIDIFRNIVKYCVFNGDIVDRAYRETTKEELLQIYGEDILDDEPLIEAYKFIEKNLDKYEKSSILELSA